MILNNERQHNMKECGQKNRVNGCGVHGLRLLAPLLLSLLASACATTGGGVHSSASSQGSAGQNLSECSSSGDKATAAQQNCVHKGPIEITENFDVDSDIKDEFQQAVALLKQEKYPDAIRLLKTVTGKTSKFTAPFIDLGIAYVMTNDFGNAEESLKKALAINPIHPAALNELGLVYRKTGRYSEARKTYEKLLQIYPGFLPAHKNLGVLCDIYIQDLNCALEQYEAYLQVKPDDQKMKIWVADVKSRM